MSRRLVLIFALLVGLAFLVLSPFSTMWNAPAGLPRHFDVGDSWTYKVVFPDSKSYQLTESVTATEKVNGTVAYVLFMDDVQHISTQYLWLTSDWYEIKAFTPHIGNLLANSTTTYTPPVLLFQVPLRVGDIWSVKSTVRTLTVTASRTLEKTSFLREQRETVTVEEISTPIGKFPTFKVDVTANGTLTESMWFDAYLGQVVYGEFYNNYEKVTQTLIGYKLSSTSASAIADLSIAWMPETRVFQENRQWKTFASYI